MKQAPRRHRDQGCGRELSDDELVAMLAERCRGRVGARWRWLRSAAVTSPTPIRTPPGERTSICDGGSAGGGNGDGGVDQPIGIYAGTSTPLPVASDEGESWVVGTPVPTALPAGPNGRPKRATSSWNGTSWVNMGKATGPTGPPGPRARPVRPAPGASSTVPGPVGPTGAPGVDGEDGTDGVDGATGPPGTVQAVIAGANVAVNSTNPAYPVVSASLAGAVIDEVWIGPDDPIAANPQLEMWFDSDGVDPGYSPPFIGELRMYGGDVVPTGWMFCNGQAISRTTYATLYAVIGLKFGTRPHLQPPTCGAGSRLSPAAAAGRPPVPRREGSDRRQPPPRGQHQLGQRQPRPPTASTSGQLLRYRPHPRHRHHDRRRGAAHARAAGHRHQLGRWRPR